MTPRLLAAAALLMPIVAFAGFGSSSFSKSRLCANNQCTAQAALDGNLKTAWIIDPEEENVGQWIELDVPMGKVDKISVVNGWTLDDQAFKDYARIKDVKVEVFDMEDGQKVVFETTTTLQDSKDRQVIDLPEPKVGGEFNGGKIRLTVASVYDGTDFAHLALSELMVHMVEFDAATVRLTEKPPSSADGHGPELLNDGDLKTFWAVGGGSETSFQVDGGKYSVSSIGLVQGPATHGRPKVVEITQSDVSRKVELVDKPGTVQWFELPAIMGYNGSAVGPVTVQIVEVYPGSTTPMPALAEVKFKATVLEAF